MQNGEICAGWEIVDIRDENNTTGMVACLIETGDENALVAFRGSESDTSSNKLMDWVVSDLGLLNAYTLLRAGFSENEILSIQSGYVPKGWQVHHKLPLDDGGTNDFSNLILIKNDPFHKVITNFQNSFAQTLSPGETTMVDYPIPEGSIYPPVH